MLGTGQDLCIILRNLELLLVTDQFLRSQFRLTIFHSLDPLITDPYRHQIRVREITVILSILFGTHRMGGFLVVIPSSGLLDHLFAFFDQLDLSLPLALNGSGNGLKGV